MTTRLPATLAIAFMLVPVAPAAAAYLPNGVPAPNFTKPQHLTSAPRSLSEFAGKVVILFQYGHNCPECLNDGPAFEQEIHQYYLVNQPAEVVVIGVNMFVGTDASVTTFKNATGANYLLLRDGGLPAGLDLDDLATGLGPNDNYVVINKQGIIRFNTFHEYAHGNRYQRDRLRACVDSLVSQNVGVGDPAPASLALAAHPNPFAGATTVEFTSPVEFAPACVTVHDIAGRRVATLWNGPAPPGATRVTWNGRAEDGAIAPAGVYLVQAAVGSQRRSLRVVRVP